MQNKQIDMLVKEVPQLVTACCIRCVRSVRGTSFHRHLLRILLLLYLRCIVLIESEGMWEEKAYPDVKKSDVKMMKKIQRRQVPSLMKRRRIGDEFHCDATEQRTSC